MLRSFWKRMRWVQILAGCAVLVAGTVLILPVLMLPQRKPDDGARLLPPQFSVPSGIYTNNFSVSLNASSLSTVVRYTLDGSEPTTSSPAYSSPLGIGNSTVLKAKAFFSGSSSSPTASQTYTIVDSSLLSFSSNLPLVILNTFGQTITKENKVPVWARIINTNTASGRSSLLGSPDFDGRGAINVRGYTSLRYPKRSFHLKTQDDAGHSEKLSLLGLPKESDWVLYAPYPDKTLMRDVLAYELSNRIGRYAPRTRFVEVFVNESGSRLTQRDYVGVYVFEEKIKRDKNRVDIKKLDPEDKTEPQITGGYIFKKDHLNPVDRGQVNQGGFPMGGGFSSNREGFPTGPGGFPASIEGFLPAQGRSSGGHGFFSMGGRSWGQRDGFTSSQGTQFLYVEPKAEEITSAQRTWLNRHVNEFENVLYGPGFKDPKNGYAAYIDVDSFIDHHLIVELTKNIDGFRFSTFFSKDRDGKIKMGPIWDWNLSLGNANGKQGWIPEHWYWPQLDDQQYSWFRRLFEDPDFAQKYVDRWGQLKTNQFAAVHLLTRVDEWAALLNESQARNFKRWRILGRSVWPNTFVGKTFEEEIGYLKQWTQTRLDWIEKQFPSAPSLSLQEGRVNPGSRLSIKAPAGKIYLTLDGTDPRLPGGSISPRAQLYHSPIKLNENASLFSRVLHENRWSHPTAAKFVVETSVSSKAN